MKTLLAIINEPKESKDFIQYVAELAKDLKANVHLLYVQNPNNYPLGATGATGISTVQIQKNQEVIAQNSKKFLEDNIKEVKSKMQDDVAIAFSTELGITSMVAKEIISNNKAEMIVLEGNKNESFWTQSSSNMEIIRSVDCPVWIIPHEWNYTAFSKIIYATDYKEEDIAGLKKLIALMDHFSPDITALHITDNVDFKEKVKTAGFHEMLQKKTAYNDIFVKVLNESNGNDAIDLLNDYASHIKANLIVVLKENNSFLERIFKSDPAKEIIKKSMLPVLVFHEHEKK